MDFRTRLRAKRFLNESAQKEFFEWISERVGKEVQYLCDRLRTHNLAIGKEDFLRVANQIYNFEESEFLIDYNGFTLKMDFHLKRPIDIGPKETIWS